MVSTSLVSCYLVMLAMDTVTLGDMVIVMVRTTRDIIRQLYFQNTSSHFIS